MLAEVLGSMIIAHEKVGKLSRWISKLWKLHLATQAAFAKLGIVACLVETALLAYGP